MKLKGFTLIEVMIVVVIIGIISAFAIPSYQSYVQRAKRTDGMAAMMNATNSMERYRAANNTYAGADTNVPFATNVPSDGGTPYYTISVSRVTATTYTLTATPTNSMPSSDGTLTITETGAKTWGSKSCWPEGGATC